MTYTVWGVKRLPNGNSVESKPRFPQSKEGMNRMAFKLFKEGWEYVMGCSAKYSRTEILYIRDRDGIFGRKNAVIEIFGYHNEPLTYDHVYRDGRYINSDGYPGDSVRYAVSKKKKLKENDYGIKGDWHPFGL